MQDVIIIGAGPTGLAAALYTAREGYSTTILESGIIGGLAAITAEIENYPGFEEGIGGIELSDKLAKQAKRFGAIITTGKKVTGIVQQDSNLAVMVGEEAIIAKAVIIATGSTYRMLGCPGEAELIGKGVHFCATCDGPVYRGREIIVVGGGNSALQETIFLARFASKITIVARADKFSASQVLIDEVNGLPNVITRFNANIASFEQAEGKFIGAKLLIKGQDELEMLEAAAVFELIGLLPNTSVFKGLIDLDEVGFVQTNMHYQTNITGVFAAGDVRSGSTWQIASAVGEGASAALEVRKYLDGQAKTIA